MKTKSCGIILINDDDEEMSITKNSDGVGWVFNTGSREWWVDSGQLAEVAKEVAEFAKANDS